MGMTNTTVPDEVLKTDVLGRVRTPVEWRDRVAGGVCAQRGQRKEIRGLRFQNVEILALTLMALN